MLSLSPTVFRGRPAALLTLKKDPVWHYSKTLTPIGDIRASKVLFILLVFASQGRKNAKSNGRQAPGARLWHATAGRPEHAQGWEWCQKQGHSKECRARRPAGPGAPRRAAGMQCTGDHTAHGTSRIGREIKDPHAAMGRPGPVPAQGGYWHCDRPHGERQGARHGLGASPLGLSTEENPTQLVSLSRGRQTGAQNPYDQARTMFLIMPRAVLRRMTRFLCAPAWNFVLAPVPPWRLRRNNGGHRAWGTVKRALACRQHGRPTAHRQGGVNQRLCR